MKKYGIFITIIGIVSFIGLYLSNKNNSVRSPSSVRIDKEHVISAVHWKIGGTDSEILIDLNCDEWSSMEVTLKSEGVAYSGEPSRVIQTSLCGEPFKGFYQKWPHDLMKDNSGIQKMGFYSELPPEWTLEKIKFFGSQGALEISAIEIYHLTGEIFVFEAL